MTRSVVAGLCFGVLVAAGCPGTIPPRRGALDGSVTDQANLYFAEAGGPPGLEAAVQAGPGDGAPGDGAPVDLGPEDGAPEDGAPEDLAAADPLRTCQRQCQVRDDCCAQPPCDSYPSRFVCTPAGLCEHLGCAGDQDCGFIPGGKCLPIDGFITCAMACVDDGDCSLVGDVCLDARYCASSRPATSPPCGPTTACPVTPKVVSRCYPQAGRCGCVDSADCQAAFGAAGGSWKCAP